MASPVSFQVLPQDADADIVAILREALARAEAGDTCGIAIVEQYRGGTGRVHHELAPGAHAALMVGELELMKYQIISRTYDR